jgi:hypothetical protein
MVGEPEELAEVEVGDAAAAAAGSGVSAEPLKVHDCEFSQPQSLHAAVGCGGEKDPRVKLLLRLPVQ